MTEIVDWPCSLVRPMNLTLFLRSNSRSAGMSLAGVEHIVGSGARRWELTLDLPRQFRRDQVREFEATVSRMDGRRNIAALCICDPFRYNARRSPAQQPWSDNTYFSDGYGWVGDNPTVSPIVVSTGAAAGATQLNIKVTEPKIPGFQKGDYFSHDGFLYHVIGRTDEGWVKFAPGARRPIPVGATLLTDPPKFYGRFADDEQGRRAREYLRWGAATSLTFVEAFDR